MTPEIIDTPKIQAEDDAIALLDQAKRLVIVTNADRDLAEINIQSAKALEDKIFAYLDPPRAKAYSDYQYHKKRLDDAIIPVQSARKAFKQACMAWDQAQEHIRIEAQRKAEAEARRQAEEAALAAAVQAEAEGDATAADAIINEPIEVAPVIVPKTAPAASRLSAGRTVWYAEVTSLTDLCKAIAEGRQPVTLIEANMPTLNKMASALKSTMNIPGVIAKSKTV